MTPNRPMSNETESAVEQLLLKKNGEKKTVADVFEIVVAMNHDRKNDTRTLLSEIKANRDVISQHLNEDVRMTHGEFEQFIRGFERKGEVRDEAVAELKQTIKIFEHDLALIRKNCSALNPRGPRRSGDPNSEDWGKSQTGLGLDDEEIGDLRRAWRVLKWVVIVIGGTLLVAAGDQISHRIFGG